MNPQVKGDSIDLEVTANTNITDWEIRAELYDDTGNSVKIANTEAGGSDDEIEIIDATNGIFELHIASGLTDNFDNDAFLEIEKVDANGKKLTIYQGDIKFNNQKIDWTTHS